jgi:hypothetical protein
MRNRQICFDRTPGFPKARAVVARALGVAALAGASLVMTASPAAAQVGDPAYGSGPGASAGQPTSAGQPAVANQAPGRAPGGPLVPAQALPNTGSGPEAPPTDWGMPAAVAALTFVGLAAVARRNLARGGRAS